ncbi:MAG: S8 family serine peptidase [Actinomycetota bacterium]|nr:S8 family serine peptidase [Actinomycetota bacterium]
MTRRPAGLLLTFLIVAGTVALVPSGFAVSALPAETGLPMPPPPPGTGERVPQPRAAEQIDSASGAPSPASTTVTTPVFPRVEGTRDVLVEVLADESATAERAVTDLSGTVIRSIAGLTLARLGEAQARRLAGVPGVHSVRPPVDLRAGRTAQGTVTADLPQVLGAWAPAGYEGAGTKVGILDIFDASVLTTQIAAGELDPIPAGQRYCFGYGQVCPFGTPGYDHGNAVAEVLADHAPGAQLFLAEVGTTTDYLAAIDWFASKGVTIVNHSGSAAFDGPGNGTGPAAAVVDYAVSRGMLWVNSVGNAANDDMYPSYSGGYWRQPWSDADGDRWMNFWGTDESMGSYCGALFGVRWSDWGASRTDYDLFISDFNASTGASGFSTKQLASANNQAAGAAPIEGNALNWLCNTNPNLGPVFDTNGDGFVNLWVYRTARTSASPTGDIIEIAVNGGWLERAVDSYSAALPFADSRNPGALAVGSSDGGYSSQGPTNDGRIKPDIAAVGCHSTWLSGPKGNDTCATSGFAGTSAAAPAVAGTAATVRLPIGASSPGALARYLKGQAVGLSAPNNRLGAGQLSVPFPVPAPTPATYVALDAPTRVLDTRPATLKGVPTAGVRPPDSVVLLGAGQLGINANPTSVVLNVAVVGASQPGWVQVFPWDWAAIGASSSINAEAAGVTRANLVIVPFSDTLAIYTSGGGHLIADVVGYFAETHYQSVGSHFSDLDPMRVFDSRTCASCSGAPRPAATFTDVRVGGIWSTADPNNGVPDAAGLRSVMVAVTVQSTSASGYMSVVPATSTGNPTTSNLNFSAGQTLTSTAIVRVDQTTGNTARIFVSQQAHITVDVLGYFHEANEHDPRGRFVSTVPYRMIDTRQTSVPPIAANTVTSVTVGNRGGIPATGVRAVFTNLTSTRATSPGPVQASATSATMPGNHTNLSVVTGGGSTAAASVTRVADGAFVLRNASPTQLIADVAGYFTEGVAPPTGQRPTPIVIPTIDGQPVNGWNRLPVVTPDGRFVAFMSDATNLAAGHTYVGLKLAVLDRQANTVEVVPIPNGMNSYRKIAISNDGNIIAFADRSTSLVVPDLTQFDDIYTYNRTTHAFTRVNVDVNGAQVNGGYGAVQYSMSGDGTKFVFVTRDQLTPSDTNQYDDTYYRDLTTGTVRLLTSGQSATFEISNDGSTVWLNTFFNGGNLVTKFDTTTLTSTAFTGQVGFANSVAPPGSTVVVPGFPSARTAVLDPATGASVPFGATWPGGARLLGASTDLSLTILEGHLPHMPGDSRTLYAINTSTGATFDLAATYDGSLDRWENSEVAFASTAEIAIVTSLAPLLPGPANPNGMYLYDLSSF